MTGAFASGATVPSSAILRVAWRGSSSSAEAACAGDGRTATVEPGTAGVDAVGIPYGLLWRMRTRAAFVVLVGREAVDEAVAAT